MGHRLVVINSDQFGEHILLKDNQKMLLGRGDDCDLQLFYGSISRKHCYIHCQDGQVYVEDAGSINGTFVNDCKIRGKINIGTEDLLQVGNIKLRLQYQHPISPNFESTHQIEKVREANLKKTQVEIVIENPDKDIPNVIFRKDHEEPVFSTQFLDPARMLRDLTLLHEIGKLVQNKRDIMDLLGTLLEIVIPDFRAERGHAAIKPRSNQSTPVFVYRTLNEGSFDCKEFQISQSVLNETYTNGHGIVSANTLGDKRFSESPSVFNLNICSAICVPLHGHEGILGAIYLDTISRSRLFEKTDLDILTAVSSQVALAIERLFIEKEEQHYRSVYQSIIENAWDVIYRRTLDNHFVTISPAVYSLLGYTQKQLLENPGMWESSIHKEHLQTVVDNKNKALLGQTCNLKYQMVRQDGKFVWVEETCYPILNSHGEITSIQGSVKNIDKTRLLEEQLARAQKMEALGVLAGGVAHDLNNILGGLMGYPDLMLMRIPDDDLLKAYLKGIKQSAERAAEIVQDLLTLGRRDRYTMVKQDLNEIVLSYLTSLDFKALQQKHINVMVDINLSESSLMIDGSSSHLGKSIMNLIINAMQAMSKTQGVLEISSYKQCLKEEVLYDKVIDGNFAVLRVSDAGEGIAEEDLKRIFEPFYSKKINKGGTGLGLAVVWGVVKDHGGYIDVKSTINKGTTFTLYLPLLDDVPEPKRKEEQEEQNYQGNEYILVIDDIEDQRLLACEFFTQLGYKVKAVSSGEEAIEFLRNYKVDILILDMVLKGELDGLDTYCRILQMHPQQKAIVVSGYANMQRIERVQSLGAGECVRKPYTLEKLAAVIRKELDK